VGEQSRVLTEYYCQKALASHFDWRRNHIFPNVYFCGGEMDIAVVTPSNYLWEFEIKLSVSDWKADIKKSKWKDPDREWIKRFYYVVPSGMEHKCPEFVETGTGIITVEVGKYYTVKVVRFAVDKRVDPIPDWMLVKLLRKQYWRFWHDKFNELS